MNEFPDLFIIESRKTYQGMFRQRQSRVGGRKHHQEPWTSRRHLPTQGRRRPRE